HVIGPRGPHVAPGSFKVTLDVDGVATESRMFEVRSDPASSITAEQHQAREAFVVKVMDLLAKVDTLANALSTRDAACPAATGGLVQRLCRIRRAHRHALRSHDDDGGATRGRAEGIGRDRRGKQVAEPHASWFLTARGGA